MRHLHDRQIRPFARLTLRRFGMLTSRPFGNIAPATPLPDGRGWGWVFVTVFVLSSCTGGRYDALLRQADSLITANPDSAWALLSAVDSADIARQSRSTQMRYQLLRAEAQNKAYVPFTTDSALRRVVRYYDRHGSANQQLKARYLLGCAYRDMHEAPLAIITWEEAVERADTLSHDCDYSTLYRVYGQMAEIYFRQYMPEKELYADQKQSDYALMAGDTINHIRALLQRNDAYLALGDTASIFKNTEYVRQLYLEHGLTQEAAQVYPSAIHIALDRGEYEKADSMMQIFENESGLFDENGDIVSSYERNYFEMGRYYLGIGKQDSAEFFFRKLLPYKPLQVDAYRGLLALYGCKQDIDSILRYAEAYEKALVEFLNQTKTDVIAQADGMYNFNRQVRIADVQRQKTDLFVLVITWLVSLMLLALLFALNYFRRKKKEKKELLDDYHAALNNIENAKRELALLRASLSKKEATRQLLIEKEEQVQQLEAILTNMEERIQKSDISMSNKDVEGSTLLKHLHDISEHHFDIDETGRRTLSKGRALSQKEWSDIVDYTQSYHPHFLLFLYQHKLSELKLKVCILTRLGLDNQSIATLLDVSMGSIYNTRTALARELFGLASARDLDKHLLDLR